jgi:type IV secretory pathway VirB4 component
MNSLQNYNINAHSKNVLNKNKLITQKSPTNKEDTLLKIKEYSLKQNFFDPTKNSPPNEFMMKLQLRMSVYDAFSNLESRISE